MKQCWQALEYASEVPFRIQKRTDMAVGQNQWYHFGVGALPILVNFSGDWDVHRGYGLLTHGHMQLSMSLGIAR